MQMIVFQLFLFCLLFTALVKFAVRGGAIDGLYFYPKPVQERAIAIGLTDRETMDRKRKHFMMPFILIMLAALLLIIGLWNGVRDYKTAYLQALLFLKAHGYKAYMPYLCNLDYVMFGVFGVPLFREHTCFEDGDYCDFKLKIDAKPMEYWPPVFRQGKGYK